MRSSYCRGNVLILLMLCLAVSLVSTAARDTADPGEQEALAKRIEGKLMAPCCGANTVDIHESPPAYAMRSEIRELLAAGKTEGEILDIFVERHGTTILAAPPPSGFNLVPYVLPVVIFVVGAVVVLIIARRWRVATVAPVEEPGDTPPEIEPEYRERLERQLQQLD